ncbi:MAG: hypothetical protein HC821_01090, partial [Lewinella sp.]|nr:hypothetical protein [Lewinella sp.]
MLPKHFYTSFIVYLFFLLQLRAQSATFSLPNVSAEDGQTVCLPVRVRDFSDIVEFGFTLTWDENDLAFQQIQNINPALTGLMTYQNTMPPFNNQVGINTAALFTDNGALLVYWRRWAANSSCLALADGLDLDDDAILFEVCLRVTGGYGDNIPLRFFNQPQNLIVNKKNGNGTCTTDAVLGTRDGSITVGVPPLVFDVVVPPGNYQPGDLFCADLVATSGFNDMQGLQFGVQFNRSILQLESILPNQTIPNNTTGVYNLNAATNCLSAAWSYTIPEQSITLAPGTVFAQVCFRITGDCNSQTAIRIDTSCNGATIEATNTVSQVPVISNPTDFRVSNCNSFGLDVVLSCPPPAAIGDRVCVRVNTGDNFDRISEFRYLLRFDPAVLRFVNTGAYNSALLMNAGDFNTANVANGNLAVNWTSSPVPQVTLAAGSTLYEVCFDVVGFAPSTPITVSEPSRVMESNPNLVLIGTDPRNCDIDIVAPTQVVLNFGSLSAGSLAPACLPVTVANFNGITRLDFTLQYDANNNLFDFVSANAAAIPGMTFSDVGGGLLLVRYNGAPITLADGAILFELCLQAIPTAVPNQCSPVGVVNFPLAPNGRNADNTINGILPTAGQSCVLFPEGFGINFDSVRQGIDSSICVS